MVQSESLHQESFVELARLGNLRAIATWLNRALSPYGLRSRVGSGKCPGIIKLLIELPTALTQEQSPEEWQEPLIRFICHQLWQLNAPMIEGVSIAACIADQPKRHILWRQTVRIITPANCQYRQQSRLAQAPKVARRPKQNRKPKPAQGLQTRKKVQPAQPLQPAESADLNQQAQQARQLQKKQRIQEIQQIRAHIRQASRRKTRLKATRALLVGGPAVAAIMVGGFLGYSRAPVDQTDAAASSQPNDNQNRMAQRPDTVTTALENVAVIKENKVPNPQDPNVTLMFAGDVTLADHFSEVMGKDYSRAFADMPEYKQADLAMVNLENPLTRATIAMPDKQFNFKADPDQVKVLTAGGVNIVNVANNHTMDFEGEGLKETLTTLDAAGIQYVGAGKDLTEARRPKIIDVKGQRIAFLSYWGEEYGAEAAKPGINSIKEDRIAEDIHAIRDQVDWVVVNFHWGQELAESPADWQSKLGHFVIDQGADMVIGHHPHVLQGAEIYRGRPIAYSMGNFIFGGNPQTDYDTAVMKVSLKDKQMKVEMLPVEVKGYQPKVAQGDRAHQILQHFTQLSSEFKQPMQPSMVLDARVIPTPTPSATPTSSSSPDSLAPAPSPSPESLVPTPAPSSSPDSAAPIPTPSSSPDSLAPTPGSSPDALAPSPTPSSSPNTLAPAPTPLPTDLEPTLPPQTTSPSTVPTTPSTSNSPATDPLASPAPATQSAAPEVPQPAPSHTPIDPKTVDILPGYGEIAPPAPSPSPSMASDAGTGQGTLPDGTLPTDPTNPGAASPQLPNFSNPADSTHSTDQLPMKLNQADPTTTPGVNGGVNSTALPAAERSPAADSAHPTPTSAPASSPATGAQANGAVNQTRNHPSISFQIQPRDSQHLGSSLDSKDGQNVALMAPSMW